MTTGTRTDPRDTLPPLSRWRRQVAGWTAPPEGLCDDEVTDIVLFRLSLLLNRATGGDVGMTFSARTALACAGGGWTAPLWHAPRCVIDLFCAATRGEVAHCATALANHRRRT